MFTIDTKSSNTPIKKYKKISTIMKMYLKYDSKSTHYAALIKIAVFQTFVLVFI